MRILSIGTSIALIPKDRPMSRRQFAVFRVVYSGIALVWLVGLLLIGTRLLGPYIARVYSGGAAPGDRVFLPMERVLYRFGRIDPVREQPWTVYARSVLAFSLVSVLGLYALQRLQGLLPLDPTGVGSVSPALAFNTAVRQEPEDRPERRIQPEKA